jgi:uncharacterized protein YjiS (DUF1127 family)
MACTLHPRYVSFDSSGQPAHRPRHTRSGIPRLLGGMADTLWLWDQKNHQRQALRDLDDRQLADIGVTREAAEREAAKWFWQ